MWCSLLPYMKGPRTSFKEALACNLTVVSVYVGDVGGWIQEIEGSPPRTAGTGRSGYHARRSPCWFGRVYRARDRMQELFLERIALRLKEFYEEILEEGMP